MACFLLHEAVQVWSATDQQHYDGIIAEVGNDKRPGECKVAYLTPGGGTKEKWVAPADTPATLRRRTDCITGLSVEVQRDSWWGRGWVIEISSPGIVVVHCDDSQERELIPAERLRASLPSYKVGQTVEVLDSTSSRWCMGHISELTTRSKTVSVPSGSGSYSLFLEAGSPKVLYEVDGKSKDRWIPMDLSILRIREPSQYLGDSASVDLASSVEICPQPSDTDSEQAHNTFQRNQSYSSHSVPASQNIGNASAHFADVCTSFEVPSHQPNGYSAHMPSYPPPAMYREPMLNPSIAPQQESQSFDTLPGYASYPPPGMAQPQQESFEPVSFEASPPLREDNVSETTGLRRIFSEKVDGMKQGLKEKAGGIKEGLQERAGSIKEGLREKVEGMKIKQRSKACC
jgi:hypothetical protein